MEKEELKEAVLKAIWRNEDWTFYADSLWIHIGNEEEWKNPKEKLDKIHQQLANELVNEGYLEPVTKTTERIPYAYASTDKLKNRYKIVRSDD